MSQQRQTLGQLGQEDWRALLWLSLASAKAVHAPLARPLVQLPLFDPEKASSSPFTPWRWSLSLAPTWPCSGSPRWL